MVRRDPSAAADRRRRDEVLSRAVILPASGGFRLLDPGKAAPVGKDGDGQRLPHGRIGAADEARILDPVYIREYVLDRPNLRRAAQEAFTDRSVTLPLLDWTLSAHCCVRT